MYRAVILLACGAALLSAQQSITSATLGGVIEDATGAVLAGVAVTTTDLSRGQELATVTGARGHYTFLRLQPGEYVLRVVDGRFAPYERTLTLAAGQAFDVPIRLTLAGRSDAVQVTANAAVVEAARTQISDLVTTSAIQSLPLNGRNFMDLALLSPGVSRTNTGVPQQFAETSAVPGTGLSVSGQRNLNNTFVVDGLSANDDAAGLAGTFFSQEVIREFQVITGGGNAEFGRTSSGIFSVTTRSGTNEWHGSAYGFLRNQRFDARNSLASAKDPLTQIQSGASIGGPIVKSRSFLFSNFEQTQRRAAGLVTISAPDVQAINTTLDSLGYAGPRITTGEYPTGYNATNYFARFDQQVATSNQIAARFNFYDIASDNARSVGGLNAISRGTRLDNRDQVFAVTDVATLSPRELNEARVQFTRSRLSAPGNDVVGPAVSIAGVANFGTSTSSPVGRDLGTIEISNALSLQRGNHFTKAGADFLLNRANIYFPGSLIAAVYSFPSMAAFRESRYSTFQQAFGDPYQSQRNPNVGLFLQDEWKATTNLTVNLGVRYDIERLAAPIRTDTNNLAPRIGLAWSPRDRKTVFRLSYGLYYDRIPLRATSNALQRDGSRYRTALLAYGQPGAPVFPAQLPAFPAGLYVNITTIDPRIENSYSHQASFQVERQLGARSTVSVGYEWVRALHLIMSRNINVPAYAAAEAASRGIPNLGRPDSRYGNISRYEGSGDSYYNGLLVAFKTAAGTHAQIRVAYTFSKTVDDVGNFFFSAPQNNFNLRDDRGLSDNDQRHRLSVAAVLKPFRGWELSPMFNYTSALPYNVQLNFDRNNDTSLNDRPAGLGRNTGRGFDYAALNLRVSRSFAFGERWRVEALAELFNLMNRVNRTVPNNVIGSATFGRATAVYDPRQLQLGLRVGF